MPRAPHSIVVGAGPAGLAVAAALRRHGMPATVLEQGPAVGQAWRARYDRLRLNTSRLTSRLAGERYPRAVGLFPTRDEFVAYLEQFAARHAVDVRTGVRVERLDPVAARWRLATSDGDVMADRVFVATGYAREPLLPPWWVPERFGGELLHAAAYGSPEGFRARDVLVVGAGSSGMEIAHDLVQGGARRVRLAVRTPPNILPRTVGGLPGDPVGVAMLKLPTRLADAHTRAMARLTLGDLSGVGLPAPEEGPFSRLARLGVSPAVVDRDVIEAVKDGRIEIVAAVEALERRGARLVGGLSTEVEAIIAATGYRCGLEAMVGHLGVLDERGVPRGAGGGEAAPGLSFVGYRPAPGQIRYSGIEARRAVRAAAGRR